MRKVLDPQLKLGEQNIASIRLDPKSRDDIPHILRGLQHIYITPEVRKRVFTILEDVIPEGTEGKANPDTGRPGMDQWKILVLGVLRQGLNADYDRIHELANQHNTLRLMLGHGDWGDDYQYNLQTIKDNLRLFTPEILERINVEVVRTGHALVKKSQEEGLNTRCDSFVAETNVHFPTDINLLFDAIRKTIQSCGDLSEANGLPGWRQSAYNIRQFKKTYRKIQRLRHSNSKDEEKRQAKRTEIEEAYEAYLDQAEEYLERARNTRVRLEIGCRVPEAVLLDLDTYMAHGGLWIDQIRRRVLLGETIPHYEKVFSLFEPHTEWIVKGKAGVPVELGLRVCVVEDNHGFILHHQVMEKTTDDQIAVSIIQEAKKLFPDLSSASFDKGFHSPQNQIKLADILDRVILPKKGKLSAADKAREYDPEFIRLRHKHSAVESAINALEVHGLDRCPDHGIDGFKRYVALAVVARNIHHLGAVLHRQEKERKRGSYNKAA
jgi:hypothetical protein